MSVSKIPVSKRLQIRWNTGLNEQMEPVYATRSFSGVKFTASDEVVHQLGTYINTLCVHVADRYLVNELHELEN